MKKPFTLIEALVTCVLGLTLLLPLVLINTAGCTNSDEATRVLRQSGYGQIEITGYRPFMRGSDDVYSTGFKAKSPSGETVTGAVTRGWFKGSTVRLD